MKFLEQYPEVGVLHIFGIEDSNDESSIWSGTLDDNINDMNMTVEEEATAFCDIVQFDYIDSYLNITLDSVNALKFALGWNWEKEPEFVVIADDDSYINIPGLWNLLFRDMDIDKVHKL